MEFFVVASAVLFLSAIIHFIAAMVVMALANRVGLIPWRRAATAHWAERARLLWPVRRTAGFAVFLVPFLLIQAHWRLYPLSSSNWIVDGFASFFGAILGCYPLDKQIFPQLDFKSWCQQTIAWWGMRFGFWIVMVTAITLMPEDFGWRTVWVAAGYLLFHYLLTRGLLLRYLRLVKFLEPAGQRLQGIVDSTAKDMANVKIRATWELGGCLANAFVFPTAGEMVFSKRTLEICNDEEIAAICAHEIAHLKESKWILFARFLGSLAVFPIIFTKPIVHACGFLGMFITLLLMLIMMRFTRSLSQRLERRADELAFKKQLNEGVYARALEKLYQENRSPAVAVNNRQTHPHLYDRMLAAGITPDFPRPARPQWMTPIGWAFVFGFVLFVVLAFAG